jgi:5-formyltetrahydrofolate cyclo-ligase
LRRQMRAARRALPDEERLAADAAIVSHIRSLPAFRSARRVALFFAFDGEPDLSPVLQHERRKEYFVPVITRTQMHFATIGAHTRLVHNFFGILEPDRPELIDPRSLDLVLTPLVAFDAAGTRVGVGAGYYDRCFSFLGQRRRWHKPKLVGTAYALQRLDHIDANVWDIPLWGAVTELGFERFHRGES